METQEQLLVQKEIRRLKKTVEAMRGNLEELGFEKQKAVQKAITNGKNANDQLKETISVLRDELEALRAKTDKIILDKDRESLKDQMQLKELIVALREQLEKADADAR